MRSGSALLLASEGAEALEGLYGSRQAQRVHARDQMVTGAASTASSATAEVRSWWETGLRRGNEGGKRGKRWRSSPRLQWASKRARGRAGDGESTAMVVGARGGRRWRRRLHRASGVLWLDEEVEGVAAELGSVSGRRGEAGGGCYGERRRWVRSDTGERGVRPGDRGGTEKKQRGVALAGQAGRRAGGVARWRVRAPGTLPSLCRGRRRQRREAGWAACWLGRPATAGLHREEPR